MITAANAAAAAAAAVDPKWMNYMKQQQTEQRARKR